MVLGITLYVGGWLYQKLGSDEGAEQRVPLSGADGGFNPGIEKPFVLPGIGYVGRGTPEDAPVVRFGAVGVSNGGSIARAES